MDNVVLKGNAKGFEVILKEGISYRQINDGFKKLMEQVANSEKFNNKKITFNIMTGETILSENEKTKLKEIAESYKNLAIRKFISNVITKEDSQKRLDKAKIEMVGSTIRNGEDVRIDGDVLFFGTIHEGGKLISTGNIYCLGNVSGILHAGFPDNEKALIIGNVHGSQQVRIGEQFDVYDESKDDSVNNSRTVIYINDLNNIEYGNLDDIKSINPKFYHRIGSEK